MNDDDDMSGYPAWFREGEEKRRELHEKRLLQLQKAHETRMRLATERHQFNLEAVKRELAARPPQQPPQKSRDEQMIDGLSALTEAVKNLTSAHFMETEIIRGEDGRAIRSRKVAPTTH
jgi:hypothetical protein